MLPSPILATASLNVKGWRRSVCRFCARHGSAVGVGGRKTGAGLGPVWSGRRTPLASPLRGRFRRCPTRATALQATAIDAR